MEIVFYSIMVMFSIAVIGGIVSNEIKDIKSNIIIKVFVLSWLFTISFNISSFMLSDTKVELVHDVLTYEGITFSTPKTISVVTVTYPKYSVLNTNTTFTVIDQK